MTPVNHSRRLRSRRRAERGSALASVALAIAILVLALAAVLAAALRGGLSARREPSALEALVAPRLRNLAIPADARGLENPQPDTPEVLAEGREHFADHCAICHANDGSSDTAIGRGLYPKAPDMRKDATQSLADGELFYIIENGVRFTGMPAFGDEGPEGDAESWELVRFIRHLPALTAEELEEMTRRNPRSAHDLEEHEAEREFLETGKPRPTPFQE